jgi:HK97 gp10 family phage protein
MPTASINVTGLEETCAALSELPTRIVKHTFARAFAAAAVPISETMRTRCPVDTGDLREHVQSKIGINSDGKGGTLEVGFYPGTVTVTVMTEQGPKKRRRQDGSASSKARFVEFGHRQVSHELKAALEGQVGLGKNGKPNRKKYRELLEATETGMVQPHPFMRPALETSADAAIEAFSNSVADSVNDNLEVSA